jgi:hypothetical protein
MSGPQPRCSISSQKPLAVPFVTSNSAINTTHRRTTYPGEIRAKENTSLNESRWRHTLIIKGFGISRALLAMVEPECRTRQTHFSEFVRYAIVAAMERGRYQAVAE